MIRTILCGMLLLSACSLPGAEPWADSDATFRVLLQRSATGKEEAASFVISDYLLPGSLQNGAKAFLPGGNELALEFDKSARALIFPSCGNSRELYLYSGYAKPQPSRNKGNSETQYNMLTMEEVTAWRLPGNFRSYLERRSSDLQRRNQRQYETMCQTLKRHTLSSFLMPPATGRFIPVGHWEINSIGNNENPDAFHFALYRSRGLTRGAEWRFFQRFPMKAFFPDRHYYRNRLWWAIDSFGRQQERNKNDWSAALATDREALIFGDLTEKFSTRLNDRSPAPRYPSELRIISRELDLNGSAVLRYSGHLDIKTAGTYEFEVETNSLWIMQLNGELAARKELDTDLSREHKFRFTRELSPGLIPFVFYYARCESPQDFAVRMRPPEGEWAILSDDSFAPAPSCRIANIELRDGREFPIIRRYRRGSFMTGKQSFRQMEQLDLPDDAALLLHNSELSRQSPWIAIASDPAKNSLSLRYRDGEFVLPPIDPPLSPVILKGALSMELRVPPTIYDNERATATVVIQNDYPQAVPLYLITATTSGVNAPEETIEPISAAPGITMLEVPLAISDGAVDVELAMPGFTFGSAGVRLVPAARLPATPEIIHDRILEPETGRICSVVIRRMGLADLRTWELPRLLTRRTPRSLLVLGASNTLPELIAERWPDGIARLELSPWPPESVNGESRLLRGLGEALRQLRSEKIDAVLFIPPTSDMPLLGTESFCRYLAILADVARDSDAIGQVFLLASPTSQETRNSRLIRFAREYGFELL